MPPSPALSASSHFSQDNEDIITPNQSPTLSPTTILTPLGSPKMTSIKLAPLECAMEIRPMHTPSDSSSLLELLDRPPQARVLPPISMPSATTLPSIHSILPF
ncbi:hypothetical protein G6F35_014626 [Rhizopus arrhizus]|nr:hypothetical protein G6F35_014626 [Rhizopus arrhizus]